MKGKRRLVLPLILVAIFFAVLLTAIDLLEKENNFDIEILPLNRTDGSVDFQVRTISYNGDYAPAHCLAIWVCDENDNFVRTLVKRAAAYQVHLVKWNQMTNGTLKISYYQELLQILIRFGVLTGIVSTTLMTLFLMEHTKFM